MQKVKKLIKVMICFMLILLLTSSNIFADELEEETDYIWLQEEITNASANTNKEPALNSRYVAVLDRASKEIIYGKNENNRVPMASTTKIMTTIILCEYLQKNNEINFNTEIEVCKQSASVGGSRLGLKTGDKITVNDLLYGLMLKSGNDAAIQIAVSVAGSVENFANLMNQKAEELGLKNSHFITPHGLDEKEHYTTAYELALIADYALNIDKIKEVVGTKQYNVNINGSIKTITNTNELLGILNGVNGVKTGFTNGAGRCLVTSVSRNNFNIITVVLGADTKKIRTKDSINLIEYIYSNYELVNIKELIDKEFEEWKKVNKNRIEICKCKTGNIDLYLDNYKYKMYPVKKENIKDIKIEIKNFKRFFEAPVYKDTEIANLCLNITGKEIINTKILVLNEVQRKNERDYLLEILRKMKAG